MAQQTHDAWVDIREIQHKHAFFYQIALGLLLVIVGVVIGAKLFPSDDSYSSNVYLNVMSVFATVVVLNRLAEKREEERDEKALKARLVMEAGSQSNETAKRAVDELRHRGWLTGDDGLLKGADLENAKLQGANLKGANLQYSYLFEADLGNADLSEANLQNTNLKFINLEGAKLWHTVFRGADCWETDWGGVDLSGADFSGVDLKQADWQKKLLTFTDLKNTDLSYAKLQNATFWFTFLQGTNLFQANLQGATFSRFWFDENSILPDGTNWSVDSDLKRFTDPNHPNFWRSDDKRSPAYRGEAPTSE